MIRRGLFCALLMMSAYAFGLLTQWMLVPNFYFVEGVLLKAMLTAAVIGFIFGSLTAD